ncbi:MAG: AraC family transcriptional regulator [Burkholderiales bacterium]|nr:AraC family transcriptional regulator [Burkholderiales bacterium]
MAGNRARRRGDGWVLGLALQAAPRLLSGMGADPARVAQRAGLDLRRLDEPDAVIPFTVIGRFLRECVRATRCEHFGLLVGVEGGFTALGIVGHLVLHSPDVRRALSALSAYLHHQEIGGVATFAVEGGVAVLDYALEERGVEAAEQIADAAMGIGLSILRYMCGVTWAPNEVQLTRATPADPSPWRRVVGAPVRFGAERNALVFPKRWLDHRIERADPSLRRVLQEKLAALEAVHGAELPSRLRGVVRTLLLAGESSSEAVARRLSISRRTLHRRLEAHGVTYERLLDETRYGLARQLLANSHASMIEISVALDYANPGAFTRAFRRWAGCSPSEWRSRPASRRMDDALAAEQ